MNFQVAQLFASLQNVYWHKKVTSVFHTAVPTLVKRLTEAVNVMNASWPVYSFQIQTTSPVRQKQKNKKKNDTSSRVRYGILQNDVTNPIYFVFIFRGLFYFVLFFCFVLFCFLGFFFVFSISFPRTFK